MTSLRKGQERYQWRLAEVRCLLVENYSNSRQVWSSRSFLQFLGGLRPNIVTWAQEIDAVLFDFSYGLCKDIGQECMSTVLTQDHFYSDQCIYKLQSSPLLWLRWCCSARELLGSCRLVSAWWQESTRTLWAVSWLPKLWWAGHFQLCNFSVNNTIAALINLPG